MLYAPLRRRLLLPSPRPILGLRAAFPTFPLMARASVSDSGRVEDFSEGVLMAEVEAPIYAYYHSQHCFFGSAFDSCHQMDHRFQSV